MSKTIALVLPVLLAMAPVDSPGQVLLRWGELSGPPPAETEGLPVRTIPWSGAAADSGGNTYQIEIDDGAIGAIGLDPQIDIAGPAQRQGGTYDGKEVVFDGDPSTTWVEPGYSCISLKNGCDDIYASPGTYEIDLGSLFLIERIVVLSGLDNPAGTVNDFRVHLRAVPPPRLWCCGAFRPVLAEVRDNRQQVREVVLPTVQRARFVQVAVGERQDGWVIHDIQIYGRGFVEEASYSSNIVAFDRPMAWGDLRWSGRKGDGAQVLIQTRTGTDPDPVRYWRFTGLGDQKEGVSRSQYEKLGIGARAGTTYDQENWSFWSAPYDFADSSGTQMVSPGPRSFFQFRVDFVPDAEDGGEVGFLELRAATPAATELVGEVWPVESKVGEWESYTYFLYPSIGDDDTGFDRLEIRSLSRLGPVVDVRVGDETVAWEVMEAEPHRFVVSLPSIDAGDSGALVEVAFEAQVLRYGASFNGRVWHSAQLLPTPQSVTPGDATGEYEGDRVSVVTQEQSSSLLQVDVTPRVLTPNGDGVNDVMTLAYEILEITGTASVQVAVFDLAGRRVRRLQDAFEGIGRHEIAWDGRDDTLRLLPPGVYLGRVSLAADRQSDVCTEVLYVSY